MNDYVEFHACGLKSLPTETEMVTLIKDVLKSYLDGRTYRLKLEDGLIRIDSRSGSWEFFTTSDEVHAISDNKLINVDLYLPKHFLLKVISKFGGFICNSNYSTQYIFNEKENKWDTRVIPHVGRGGVV